MKMMVMSFRQINGQPGCHARQAAQFFRQFDRMVRGGEWNNVHLATLWKRIVLVQDHRPVFYVAAIPHEHLLGPQVFGGIVLAGDGRLATESTESTEENTIDELIENVPSAAGFEIWRNAVKRWGQNNLCDLGAPDGPSVAFPRLPDGLGFDHALSSDQQGKLLAFDGRPSGRQKFPGK